MSNQSSPMPLGEDEDTHRIVVRRLASLLGAKFEDVEQEYLEQPRNVKAVLRRHEYAAALPAEDRPVCNFIDSSGFVEALSNITLKKALFTLARLYDEAHIALHRATKPGKNRFEFLKLNRNISLRECGQTLRNRPGAVDDQIFIEYVGYGDAGYKAVFRQITPMFFEKSETLRIPPEILLGERKDSQAQKYTGIGGTEGSDIISASLLGVLLTPHKQEKRMDLLVSTRTWATGSQGKKGGNIGAQREIKTHAPTRRLLPMHVNGVLETTVPDSGSFANIMSEQYAKTHQISIDRDRRKQEKFQNAAGVSFTSIGQAKVTVTFADCPHEPMTEVFSIVRGCVTDLIMGSRFLQTHSILARFKHRLIKLASSARKHWRLMQMFLPRQRFLCTIDGLVSKVALDTGSDKNFISSAFARENDWNIKRLEYEQFVKLANGQELRVLGYVDKDIGIADYTQEARFYVLRDLTCDAIFGDELIDEVDFFTKIEETTWSRFWTEIHEDQTGSPSECFAIEWLDRVEQQVRDFYSNPAYKIPADVLEYLNSGNTTTSSNNSTLFSGSMRRRWAWSRSSRLVNRQAQYDALQSGLWLKLRKIDVAELHAKQQARVAISLATGADLQVLTDEDIARHQKHQDERGRLIALRQGLLEWRKLHPTL